MDFLTINRSAKVPDPSLVYSSIKIADKIHAPCKGGDAERGSVTQASDCYEKNCKGRRGGVHEI